MLHTDSTKDLTADATGARKYIAGCHLTHFNMSDNRLDSFPYYALHKMEMVKKIDLGRNRITSILDDAERNLLSTDHTMRRFKKMPLAVFKVLTTLDLSSNLLTVFPEELNCLDMLKELNLMNNKIETIPSSFYTSKGPMEKLKRLILS